MSGFIVVVAFSLFWVLLVIDDQGGMGLRSWVGMLNFVFLEFYCFVILGVRFSYALSSGTLILLAFEAAMRIDRRITSDVLLLVLSCRNPIRVGGRHRLVARIRAAQGVLDPNNAEGGEGFPEEPERSSRKRGRKAHPRNVGRSGCDDRGSWRRWWRPATTKPAITSAAPSTMSGPWLNNCDLTRRFAGYLSEHQIDILFKSAPLHDIGKVGIPDSILLKPGQLDAGRIRDHEDPYDAWPRRDREC